MRLELIRAGIEDTELIWKMQITAFAGLLEKYQDIDTNPGSEPAEKVRMRLAQPFTYYYLLKLEDTYVGAIRVVDKKEEGKRKKISPLFVLPQFRNMGLAQEAILAAEELHGKDNWELETILSEAGNCYLYEKMGYVRNGKTEVINDKLTLVFYQKDIGEV